MICDQDTIDSKRQVLAQTLSKELLGIKKDIVLCCILKGAAYFAVDLSRDLCDLNVEHSIYFVEASSYKGQTQNDNVSIINALVPSKFENKHVLLVDELFDNGKTMYNVRQYLVDQLNLSQSDITTCVMFLKSNKKRSYPDPDFYAHKVPNVWLVGYGLDDNGVKRGLRDVYAVPKGKQDEWTSDDWKIFVCQ